MSHISTHQDAARLNNRNHTGAARQIREALQFAPGSLSAYKLCLATGIPLPQIRSALAQLVGRTGGVVAVERAGHTEYDLHERVKAREPKPASVGEFAMARPITVGRGMRWYLNTARVK